MIPPGGSVKVYAGEGGHFGTEFFWNLTRPVFENTSRDDRGIGDGAYLFDPQGDVRAWMMYPCRVNCADPAQGSVQLATEPRGRGESISVRNTGPAPLDLENYTLKTSPYSYAFATGTILNPGETLRLYTQGDPAADTHVREALGDDEADPQQLGRHRDVLHVHRHARRVHGVRLAVLLTVGSRPWRSAGAYFS